MIRLVATDLDNTLMPAGTSVSGHALEAIRSLTEAGVRFAPVTGRPPAAMRWIFGPDDAYWHTGAFVNGQMIYVDGELVRVEALDVGLVNDVADFLRDVPNCVLCVYDLDVDPGADEEDGTAYHLGATAEQLLARPEAYGSHIRVLDRLDWDRCIKANIRCDMGWTRMEDLRAQLRNRFPALDFVFPVEGGRLIDLAPAGWGKGRAIEALARQLGVGLDEVVVFGDSENDLPMLQAVENSVAVANASAAAKATARWHVGDVADDAVADALLQIAGAAATGTTPSFMRA